MTDLERANQRAASAEKEAAMLQERWVVEERKKTFIFCEFRLQELNKQESGEQVNLEAEGEGLALSSAQRVGFFNIGSGRVGYWTKYRVAGRVRVG